VNQSDAVASASIRAACGPGETRRLWRIQGSLLKQMTAEFAADNAVAAATADRADRRAQQVDD
jgi:hypothetical protein